MLYPWRIRKWECIFRFASTKVLQSTQMLGLPFLLVMIMGREAWWRWRRRCRFIGDDNDDEEEDCIGDFCICENFQGCQVHWGDQEFVAGVHHKSLPISSARGANILVHLHNTLSTYAPDFPHLVLSTWFSPPSSLHLALSTFTWLFSGSIPLQVAVEESCIYTCTPDWNPVIDTVPGSHNVVFAVGFSGDNLIFFKGNLAFLVK